MAHVGEAVAEKEEIETIYIEYKQFSGRETEREGGNREREREIERGRERETEGDRERERLI